MTTKLRAHFDGKVLVPQEPVELPTDCVLEVRVQRSHEATEQQGALSRLAEAAARIPVNPDAPSDGATQHDHHLYGTPKRQ